MYFVEGLAPNSFKVWKYCRLMVLKSAVMATEHFIRVALNPSAFGLLPDETLRLEEWPIAYHLRPLNSGAFSPSATVMLAWRFFRLSTTARRSRSAAICRFIPAGCRQAG